MHAAAHDTTRGIIGPCTCATLRRASRRLTQIYDDALQSSGLRVTQFSLLRAISRAGATSITGLADELLLDRTTMTRNIKPLERRGLIKIVIGEDQRERTVSLTGKGREALIRATPLWENAQALVRDRLGSKGLQALTSVLSRLE